MADRLCDPQQWQDAAVLFDRDAVAERIPHRHEMHLLHGVVHHEPEGALSIGFHDTTPDDFWVRGHIPGRPIMPGVVMVEAAAQLCSFMSRDFIPMRDDQMFGFGGINAVRFRGSVKPGERLLLAPSLSRLRRTMGIFRVEAYSGTEMAFEGDVIGVAL